MRPIYLVYKKAIKKLGVLIVLAVVLCQPAIAQLGIGGPACAQASTTVTYSVTGTSYGFNTGMTWTVTGGTISGTSSSPSHPVPSITVIWGTGASGTVHLVATNPSNTANLNVSLYTAFFTGTLGTSSQTINYSATPATISCTAASGGYCSPAYTYQWQQSPDGVNWTAISGAGGLNLTFSSGLTTTTYFQRKVTETNSGTVAYSSSSVVYVSPALHAGAVGPSTQTVNYGGNATPLSVTGITGGNGTYSYQWQSAPDNITWTNVSGQTTASYTPTGVISPIYYQVKVTSNGVSDISASAYVGINPALVSGAISPSSQSIGYNLTPTPMTISGTTGGSGTYTYQWVLNTGSGYVPISGATSTSYTPTQQLTANAMYEVVTTSNGTSVTSGPVVINVGPSCIAGQITPGAFTLASGANPGSLTATPAIGGGCGGIFSYQWQSSLDGVTYTNIAGATTLSYSPGALSANIFYRLQVVCGSETVYSNICRIIIGPISASLNFIRTRDILKSGVMDTATARGLTATAEVRQVTQYFDGLDRPIQTVSMNVSPLGKDMVAIQSYDNFGREANHYLPYVSPSTDGNFKGNFYGEQSVFNSAQYPSEIFYYGQTIFEASPANRALTAYSPGSAWIGSGRGMSQNSLISDLADSIRSWTISATAGSLPVTSGSYATGLLYKNISVDESGHQMMEFKDMQGKVILKRVQFWNTPATGHSGWLNTYYVYDDLNNLRFVIQPRAVEWLMANSWNFAAGGGGTIAAELCFRYEYDQRRRMIIRKVPAAEEVRMVYDARDRMVMSQDSVLRSQKKWRVIFYDVLNRPDTLALITDPVHYYDRAYHQNLASASAAYPNTSGYTTEVLTQMYYDDYAWVTAIGGALTASLNTTNNSNSSFFFTTYNTAPNYAVAINQFPLSRGQSTGTRSKVIGTTQYLYNIPFYDDHGRVIQVESTNYTNGLDLETIQYDFTGKPLRKLLTHQKNGTNPAGHVVLTKITYDAASRPASIRKVMDGQEARIDTMYYNELGQLRAKYLGNNIDSLVYDYNIRGWMTGINKKYVIGTGNNFFGMELGYNNSASGVTTYTAPQYNGNIAGTVWKSAGDGVGRKYDFAYDNLNRLTGADFTQNNGGGFAKSTIIDFSVPNITYDANGNIQSMAQKGFKVGGSSPIDQLRYSYVNNGYSNRLQQVYDSANDVNSKLGDFHYPGTSKLPADIDYTYDYNGSLTTDKNKGILSIHYNFLNLPDTISMTRTDGSSKGNIVYKYDAGGNKLAKIVTDSTGTPVKITKTLYIQGFQYQNDTIQFVAHDEGRTRYFWQHYMAGDSSFRKQFDYFEKDHLGNTRIVLTEQKDTGYYAATMEGAYRAKENSLFYNIPVTAWARSAASGYPVDLSMTNPNDSVSKLNGSGQKVGPAIILKVMSGDSIKMAVNYFFNTSTAPNGQHLSSTDLINSLAMGIVGVTGGAHGSFADLTGSSTPLAGGLGSFINDNNGNAPGKPNAYLNWILLDDQFNYVSTGGQSGAMQVATAGTTGGGGLQAPLGTNFVLKNSGYLYIYVSNATPGWDVFFDNLSVLQYGGPMVEENHYYPFGLTMTGISDKALKTPYTQNKYRYNGKEMQNQEFSDGTGLEEYDYGARLQDPQLGLWHNSDPLADKSRRYSPYVYAIDNPIRFIDPDGMEAAGADGLTQDQWIESSRPGADGNLTSKYKEMNQANTSNGKESNNPDDIVVNGKSKDKKGKIRNKELLRIKTSLVDKTVNTDEVVDDNTKTTVVDLTPVENTIRKADAWELMVGADFAFGGGIGGSLSTVFINKGNDKGVYFYRTGDLNFGFNIGAGLVAGPIVFNQASGASFDRSSFVGWSTNVSGGFGPASFLGTRAYTDGDIHLPGFNNATTLYTGVLMGPGISSLRYGAMFTYSYSAIIASWSIPRK